MSDDEILKSIEKPRVSDGSACILVYDDSLAEGSDADFYGWLRMEGFKLWDAHGYWKGVTCAYVNLNSKIFAPGMPGIKITTPLGHHGITIQEFKTIYDIYKCHQNDSFM